MDEPQLIHEKIEQAVAILQELDIDVWLTFARETSMSPDPALELIYGGDVTWQSAFLIGRNGRRVAIVGHFDADGVRSLRAYDEVTGYHEGFCAPLLSALTSLDPRTIAVNFSEDDPASDGLSHGLYCLLEGCLAGSALAGRLVSAGRVLFSLRGRKTPTEIARVRRAVATTERLFDEIEAYVRPGMTEREIAAFVHRRVDELGCGYAWPKPYNPIVTCGPESGAGHAVPGDVVLRRGHLLHIDLGIRQENYSSDLQRMWYVPEADETAAPPEVQHAFDVVLGALRAGESALLPGTPGWQVDQVARDFIVDNGFLQYMHAFGHLVGRVAHDGATVLGPRWERYKGVSDLPVEIGNIFALELHVIVPQRGTMSLEENVLVTEAGTEYLSTPQTALRYIR